jgi:hypothetical protein
MVYVIAFIGNYLVVMGRGGRWVLGRVEERGLSGEDFGGTGILDVVRGIGLENFLRVL